eukprot:jgi/Galph1/5399/GphlegSOOS_G4019.1
MSEDRKEPRSSRLRRRAASVEERPQVEQFQAAKHSLHRPKLPVVKHFQRIELEDEPKAPQGKHRSSFPSALVDTKEHMCWERHRTCSITDQPPAVARSQTTSPILRACCLLFAFLLAIVASVLALYLRNNMAAAHSFSFFCFTVLFFGSFSFYVTILTLTGYCTLNFSVAKTSPRTLRLTFTVFFAYLLIIYLFPFDRKAQYEMKAREIVQIEQDSIEKGYPNASRDSEDYMFSTFSKSGKFQLLSYNIFIRPPGVNSNGNDYKDERLLRFLSHMAHYDIICLQELFTTGSDRWQALTNAAKVLGFAYEAHLGRKLFSWLPKIVDGGVTILSRFPILSTDSLFFERASYSTIDCIVGKGVLYAKIELPLSEPCYLHLFSTHLQAGDEPRKEMMDIKLAQLKQIRDFIYSKLNGKEREMVILCGDLNVNGRINSTDGRDSEDYIEMIRLLSSSASNSLNENGELLLQWQDVIRNANQGIHPITVGDADVDNNGNIIRKWELQLASKGDRGCRKRLDYILLDTRNSKFLVSPTRIPLVEPFFLQETLYQGGTFSSVDLNSRKPRWRNEHNKPFPFVQLSDHYGVSVKLERDSSLQH